MTASSINTPMLRLRPQSQKTGFCAITRWPLFTEPIHIIKQSFFLSLRPVKCAAVRRLGKKNAVRENLLFRKEIFPGGYGFVLLPSADFSVNPFHPLTVLSSARSVRLFRVYLLYSFKFLHIKNRQFLHRHNISVISYI